jgi:hypothetical protein
MRVLILPEARVVAGSAGAACPCTRLVAVTANIVVPLMSARRPSILGKKFCMVVLKAQMFPLSSWVAIIDRQSFRRVRQYTTRKIWALDSVQNIFDTQGATVSISFDAAREAQRKARSISDADVLARRGSAPAG